MVSSEHTQQDISAKEIAALQQAVQLALVSQEAASHCFQYAQQNSLGLLGAARALGMLTEPQCQQLLGQLAPSSTAPPISTPLSKPMSGSQVIGRREGLPQVGQSLGDYSITRILGRGAMGVVYAGERGGVEFAIKLILGQADPESLIRFEREAQALAQVDKHPNIVSIHKYVRRGQDAYFVLDLVDGSSLDKAIPRHGGMNLDHVLSLMIKIAAALEHVHQHGITHRDLKPANILIRKGDQEPLLSDFGIVKDKNLETLTQAGDSMGTPAYMDPQQLQGQKQFLGPTTDIWSLGVVFYQLLSSRLPFPGPTVIETCEQIIKREPVPMSEHRKDLPDTVWQIILRCLDKDPSERYQSAQAFLNDCLSLQEGGGLSRETEASMTERAQARLKRQGLVAAIVALVVVTLTAVGVMSFAKKRRQFQQQRRRQLALKALTKASKKVRQTRLNDLSEALLTLAKLHQTTAYTDALRANALIEELNTLKLDNKQQKLLSEVALNIQIRGLLESSTERPPRDEHLVAKHDSHQCLLDGLRFFQSRHFEAAILSVKKWPDSIPEGEKLKGLALALLYRESQEWKLAFEHYRALNLPIEILEKLGTFELECLREKIWSELCQLANVQSLSRALNDFEKCIGKAQPRNTEQWQKLNAMLSTRLLGADKAVNVRLKAQIYERMKLVQKRHPKFKLPVLNDQLHKACGDLADTEGRTFDAYHHYLMTNKLRHNFVPPEKYSHKAMSEIGTEAVLGDREALRDMVKLMLASARAGNFISGLLEEIRFRVRESKLLDEFQRDNPADPYPRLLRGLTKGIEFRRLDPTAAFEKELKADIADLSFALKHEGLAPVFEALAITALVERQLQLCRVFSERHSFSLKDCLARLERAGKLPHPRPDQVEFCRVDAHIVAETNDPALMLRCLRRAELLVELRKQRTADHQLALQRPWGSPLDSLRVSSYRQLLVRIHNRRGLIYLKLKQTEMALKSSERCLALFKMSKEEPNLATVVLRIQTLIAAGQKQAALDFIKRHPKQRDHPNVQRLLRILEKLP